MRYSVPLSMRLFADEPVQTGLPVCMFATNQRIQLQSEDVDTHSQQKENADQPFIAKVVETMKKQGLAEPKFNIVYPSMFQLNALDYMSVKAAVVTALVAASQQKSNEVSIMDLQKMTYELEKELFHHESYAQTIPCLHGGMYFYRKEFEFYKTMIKLPIKLPKKFNEAITLAQMQRKPQKEPQNTSQSHTHSRDKHIRRFVYSIAQEDLKMFKEVVGDGIIVDRNSNTNIILKISETPQKGRIISESGLKSEESRLDNPTRAKKAN